MKLFEQFNKTAKIEVDGIYYHGSVIYGNRFFDRLYSPTGGGLLFFTENNDIAYEYSCEHQEDLEEEYGLATSIIFTVKIKSDNIADLINNEVENVESHYHDNISEKIDEMGFDGWETRASSFGVDFEECAIFEKYANRCIEYVSMSFIFENDAFYDIPMSEAKDFFIKKISSML